MALRLKPSSAAGRGFLGRSAAPKAVSLRCSGSRPVLRCRLAVPVTAAASPTGGPTGPDGSRPETVLRAVAQEVEVDINEARLIEEDELQQKITEQRRKRREQRVREQATYKFSAIAASTLLTCIAIVATYYRFTLHAVDSLPFPTLEFFMTLLLIGGGAVGMEMYARYAHRILWHDFQPGWALHKSHHEPRTGPFEANDIYALANALPAMALCGYGFLTPGIGGGICFGLGLGITLFGISYMFVHDGMVHRRFPVGPIAELPYLKRVAVAHQVHHSERFDGVPYGLFFGPHELEACEGGKEYLDMLVEQQDAKASR